MLGFFLLPFKRENFVDVFYHTYSSMLSGIYFSHERFEKDIKLILFGISLTFYVSTTVFFVSSVELSAANVCATIIFN